jgi:hypothetical protein
MKTLGARANLAEAKFQNDLYRASELYSATFLLTWSDTLRLHGEVLYLKS